MLKKKSFLYIETVISFKNIVKNYNFFKFVDITDLRGRIIWMGIA